MKSKKAFTLIELIVVLVILAIISLIVTPLVLNIVDKAKVYSNKRSIDAYGKAIDLAITAYLMDTGDFPTSIEELTIEYTGSKVECGVAQLNEDSSVYLSKCKVDGIKVKDSKNKDGWYHYGTKATYEEYMIGDEVTYNGMDFYVIANSDENSDSVTMLKAEPLTVDEVNTYGAGHVNRYTRSSVGTANDYYGYGIMAYYSSPTCGYPIAGSSTYVETGCTTDYAQSEVKYAVDAWAADKFQTSDLKEDETGYSARLITYDDLFNNLGYNNASFYDHDELYFEVNPEYTPLWVYNMDYLTMSPYEGNGLTLYIMHGNGALWFDNRVYSNYDGSVRPVVTLKKSAL